jgi:hypothetical protein
MTQYKQAVNKQRLLLEAEKWAESVKSLHVHSLNSMWYDNRPQDTENNTPVTDIQYNSGLIERKLSNGKTVYFGAKLQGEDLIREFVRTTSPAVTL